MKPLEKLFWDEIGELLHVEELLLKALPKMKESAFADNIKDRLEDYRVQVQVHSKKVRDLFQLFEVPPREKKCDAMMGILVRGQQLMQRSGPGPALDSALAAQMQKILGYKRAAYASAVSWARALHEKDAAKSLEKSLTDESRAGEAFEELSTESCEAAAKQVEEVVRKPVARTPRRSREMAEGARWGEW